MPKAISVSGAIDARVVNARRVYRAMRETLRERLRVVRAVEVARAERRHALRAAIGIATLKVEPCVSTLVTDTVVPSRSLKRFTSASPSPTPPYLRDAEPST